MPSSAPERFALAVCVALVASAAAAAEGPAPDLAPAADWTLSDPELFEAVKAETSQSTLGHERSVRAGPVEHCDADDPGPEHFPSPRRGSGTAPASQNFRVGARAIVGSAHPRSSAPVPLRL